MAGMGEEEDFSRQRGKEVFVCIFASGYLPASDQVCSPITLQASEEVY
jgi:hypothetical protein